MAIMVVFCVARVMTMALIPAVRPLQTMHSFIWWCKASLHCNLTAAQPMAAESSKTVLQTLIGNRLSGCCGMEGCKSHVLLLWWWAAAVNIADSGSCYISKLRQRAYAAGEDQCAARSAGALLGNVAPGFWKASHLEAI